MADTAVEITSGTGTNIDTRTEATNGHHRQVVVLGDPATNAGVAPVDATAGLKVDLGADNDITGTVTAELSATDNAVLDSIDTKLTDVATQTTLAAIKAKTDNIPALGQALDAGSVPVVLTASQITTLTPPAAISGFATSAKQDTIIGHIDGVETLLGTIDADTSVLAGAVTANKVQVDVISMPAGGSGLTDTELRATPVPVSLASVPSHAVTNAGTFAVQVTSAPSTTVTATDLDVRPLVNTDVVTAELSAVDNAVLDVIAAKDFSTETTLAAMNAKMVTGTDIGDVTINNAAGASAVNIQDGGNVITVDGTVSANATLTAETTKVIGTVRVASGGIASGSLASGSIAAGAIAAGATSIATTEDTASAAADHLVKIAQIRLDTPVANANVNASGDYTQIIADNMGKTWTADVQSEDAAHTSGDRGSFMLAVRTDSAAPSSGTTGDYEALHTDANGKLWVNSETTVSTTGGWSVGNYTSGDTYTALTNSAQVIKASAGKFGGYYIYNPNSSAVYVMVYNIAAASVTVGTSTAKLVFCIPASSGANLELIAGIPFDTAMSIATATTGGGATAPATALEAMIFYV